MWHKIFSNRFVILFKIYIFIFKMKRYQNILWLALMVVSGVTLVATLLCSMLITMVVNESENILLLLATLNATVPFLIVGVIFHLYLRDYVLQAIVVGHNRFPNIMWVLRCLCTCCVAVGVGWLFSSVPG